MILKNKEPENPVMYLSKMVKKLDIQKRNGVLALIIVNLVVIVLLKLFLSSSGLLN